MPSVVLTLDAVSLDHREKMYRRVTALPYVVASSYQYATTLVETLTSAFDFFMDFSDAARDKVYVYPLELARRTEFDDLETRLRGALIKKLGATFAHVAVGIAGDAHDAFDSDITTGRRTDSTLADAHARAAMLRDRSTFERVAKTFSPSPRIAWASDHRIDLDFLDECLKRAAVAAVV